MPSRSCPRWLQVMHASTVTEIMREYGFGKEACDKVEAEINRFLSICVIFIYIYSVEGKPYSHA